MILTPELIQRADAAGRTVTDDAETLSYSGLAARVAETVEKLDAQPWAAPGYTVALPLTNDIAGICAYWRCSNGRCPWSCCPRTMMAQHPHSAARGWTPPR